MTGNEYQKLAMRTCNIPYDRKKTCLGTPYLGWHPKLERYPEFCRKSTRGMRSTIST